MKQTRKQTYKIIFTFNMNLGVYEAIAMLHGHIMKKAASKDKHVARKRLLELIA